MRPGRTAIAIGARVSEPGPSRSAAGMAAQLAADVVMRLGRRRARPAIIIASTSFPRFSRCLPLARGSRHALTSNSWLLLPAGISHSLLNSLHLGFRSSGLAAVPGLAVATLPAAFLAQSVIRSGECRH